MAQARLNIYDPKWVSYLLGSYAVLRSEELSGLFSLPQEEMVAQLARQWSLEFRATLATYLYDRTDASQVSLEQPDQGSLASSEYDLELIVELAAADAPRVVNSMTEEGQRTAIEGVYGPHAARILAAVSHLMPKGAKWFVWLKGYNGTGFEDNTPGAGEPLPEGTVPQHLVAAAIGLYATHRGTRPKSWPEYPGEVPGRLPGDL
jgi:hypothetical protein